MSPNSSSPCELSFYHLVFVMKMICDLDCLSIVDGWRQHIFSLDLPQPQTTRRSPRTVSNFFAGYYTKPRLRLHELDSNTFYKIHFHNENRLIKTESSSSRHHSWLYSTHFSSGLIPYINHFHYENNVTQFSKWKSTCWWLAISVATNGGNTFFHWSYLHHPQPIIR